jgi:hypothetical protein
MKERRFLKILLAGVLPLGLFSGCGGSNSVSQADRLPVGSTLSVIMETPSSTTNSPFKGGGFICYVQTENVGLMNYNSLQLAQPNAFSYTRSGQTATFKTSFALTTGTYIADGPVTVNEQGYVTLTICLDLGSDPERAFLNNYSGTCTYEQYFAPLGESTVPYTPATGSGTFSLRVNGSSSDISTVTTATSTSTSS